MAQTITNQASLNYEYNGQTASAVSNIATAVLSDPLSAAKNAVETGYKAGDELTYAVSLVNSGTSALTNVTVADDLGSYTLGTATVTPLSYTGPALLYVNGVYNGTVTPTVGTNSVSFTVPSLAAGANAQIIYKALVSDAAPLAADSDITNTVTVSADGLSTSVTADDTLSVEDYADVSVTKSMSPTAIVDGSAVTYSFTVYNYGNTEATSIVLSDSFNPAPASISVTVNGTAVDASNYTYSSGTLTLPTGTAYELSLPAATITQDSTTGVVSVSPSSMLITVTGTL